MTLLPLHDWDCHHMSEAYLAARKSKDRRTQVGAVIVPPDHDFSLKGYNGPLRGLDDNDPSIYVKPATGGPSPFMAHAERNAMANAARVGIPIKGCTMYCTLVSCQHCAAEVVQGGLKEIVFHEQAIHTLNATQQIGLEIFRRAKTEVRYWSGTPLIHHVLYDGRVVDVSMRPTDIVRPRISSEEFNSLPENVRRYIMFMETDADPSGTIRSEMLLRDQVELLEARLNEKLGAPVAYMCEADVRALQHEPHGDDLSISPIPRPDAGMNLPLYSPQFYDRRTLS